MTTPNDFGGTVREWTLKVQARNHDVFVNTVAATLESITEGSRVTGAPGQPVQSGRLKGSWGTQWTSETSAIIATNVIYAPFIENGVSWQGTPMTLRSSVGGFHSVALTVMNFDRIVAAVTAGENTGRMLNRPRDPHSAGEGGGEGAPR